MKMNAWSVVAAVAVTFVGILAYDMGYVPGTSVWDDRSAGKGAFAKK